MRQEFSSRSLFLLAAWRRAPGIDIIGIHERLFASLERSLRKYFGRKGESAISANLKCIERAYNEVAEIQPGFTAVAHLAAAGGGD